GRRGTRGHGVGARGQGGGRSAAEKAGTKQPRGNREEGATSDHGSGFPPIAEHASWDSRGRPSTLSITLTRVGKRSLAMALALRPWMRFSPWASAAPCWPDRLWVWEANPVRGEDHRRWHDPTQPAFRVVVRPDGARPRVAPG